MISFVKTKLLVMMCVI